MTLQENGESNIMLSYIHYILLLTLLGILNRDQLRWAGHVARMEQFRSAYRVLVGKPERKKPLGRPRCKWEDNIKMDLREVSCDPRDWINLAENRDKWRAYVRAVMYLWVPEKPIS